MTASTTPPAAPFSRRRDADIAALAARLDAFGDGQGFRISWCVKNLQTGEGFGRAADVPTPSASTRKILFMMAALKAVHEGKLSMSEPVTVTEYLMTGVISGICYFMTPGLTFPLRDAIVQMIITSDNVCTSIVGERLGVAAINDYARAIGMRGTTITEIAAPREMPVTSDFDFVAHTTPADQVLLLEMIAAGARSEEAAGRLGVTAELCRFALDVLSWQRFREMIPGLLPIDTRVCNKTGSGRNGVMDAGIVCRGGEPLYAIGAYTHEVPWTMPDGLPGHAMARRAVAELSRACWDFF